MANNMQQITLWYQFNRESQNWELNHLEEGHSEASKPTPKVPAQERMWANGKWDKKHAWLNDDVPPKVVYFLEPESK